MTSSSDAPLDDLILSVIKPNWQKVAMVLGKARRLSESRGLETSYDALAARVTALCMEVASNRKEIFPSGGVAKCGFLQRLTMIILS